MATVKVSIALPPDIHRAAKLEALDRGSLTKVIEAIIDAKLTGNRLPRAGNTVDAPAVRASVLLPAEKLQFVAEMAGHRFSANSLIQQWTREYFERRPAVDAQGDPVPQGDAQ